MVINLPYRNLTNYVFYFLVVSISVAAVNNMSNSSSLGGACFKETVDITVSCSPTETSVGGLSVTGTG